MSPFHKVKDMYFDTLKLADELERLPPKCDCCDAGAHLAGKCCCAMPRPGKPFSNVTGCLTHIAGLKQLLRLFDEDAVSAGAAFSSLPSDALRQVQTVLMLKNTLMTALTAVEERLNQPESECAQAALEWARNQAAKLRGHAAAINQVL